MSSFTFIPRSISKGKNKPLKDSAPKSTSTLPRQPSTSQTQAGPSSEIPQGNGRKESELSEDLLALLELSFSDYSFWCNPELKHAVQSGQDGYVPLKYLIDNIVETTELHPRPSEVDLMKAARTSLTFETRMMIAEPSRNMWFGRNAYEPQDSGFEIRRRDWQAVLETCTGSERKKDEWDQYTIYIERIPIGYRTKPKIARYIQTLLSCLKDEPSPKFLVQSITFPRYHLAAQNEQPRCKGFAFVILDSLESVKSLCESYPWEGRGISASAKTDLEASKFGTRVISKEKWDVLKSEYLAYQKQLLAQVSENPEPLTNISLTPKERSPPTQVVRSMPSVPRSVSSAQEEEEDAQMPSSWFPQNCLLFVRHVHPDTNKTTLRALFTGALPLTKNTVDYVDFNKGIDSCHLRFASPSAAAALVSHFTDNEVAQSDALDQIGTMPSSKRPRIVVELVQGKREELYWEKVPEKAREAAMARLLSVCDGVESERLTAENLEGKRKRRRRN
ncbi:hypothetical protein BU17DRAFT_46252 [Hysterangium stoloniferum]|nr:hypothetical protein BU17DRAFT_46252 [Hysterangium stoloniferum]